MTQFIKIPKQLFTDDRYKTLSSHAKLLYALLLDRRSLSEQNGVCDKNGNAVVFCKRDEAGEVLNLSPRSAQKIFEELKEYGLLCEKPQGVGKTYMMYVKNFRCRCTKASDADVQKLPTNNTDINNTDINNTDLSQSTDDADLLHKILFNSEIEIFDERTEAMLENAITKIFYSKTLTVDGIPLSQPILRSKLMLLTGDALIMVIDKMKQKEGEIDSPSKYLMSAIVNAADDYTADCLIY